MRLRCSLASISRSGSARLGAQNTMKSASSDSGLARAEGELPGRRAPVVRQAAHERSGRGVGLGRVVAHAVELVHDVAQRRTGPIDDRVDGLGEGGALVAVG